MSVEFTNNDRSEICEILTRRANDVATFRSDVKTWTGGNFQEFPGSVMMALDREVARLRELERRLRLADTIESPKTDDEEADE